MSKAVISRCPKEPGSATPAAILSGWTLSSDRARSPTYSKGKFQESMEFEFKSGFILTPEF
jgi:hypothetical protein